VSNMTEMKDVFLEWRCHMTLKWTCVSGWWRCHMRHAGQQGVWEGWCQRVRRVRSTPRRCCPADALQVMHISCAETNAETNINVTCE